MKHLSKILVVNMLVIFISCSSDDDNDSELTNECELSWTEELIESGIEGCIDGNSTREQCTCVMDKTVMEFTPCEIGLEKNEERQIQISLDCGLGECEIAWTTEMKQAAIEECTDENNSVAICTCVVDTIAEELTVCETLTPDGLAKQAEISLECGIQPTID